MTTTQAIHVTGLYTYPIKSCGRISHDTIALEPRGLVFDRKWMIVTPDDGVLVTQRELPPMALIQPAFDGDTLSIAAPGMESIRVPLTQSRLADRDVIVWHDTCRAVDEGDAAAAQLSAYLGVSVRLVRMDDDNVRAVSMDYTDQPSQTGFADGYPILVAGEESLFDLNERLSARGKSPLLMTRFRPNIVIKGGASFAEDEWKWIEVGGVKMEVAKPCGRCAITTVEQESGTQPDAKEPLATLATFRKFPDGKVMFGQNVIHRELGDLAVGATVRIL